MKINIDFLIITYIVGLFTDWVLQVDWQANNKSKWSKDDNKLISFIAVFSHSCVYAGSTTFIVGGIILTYLSVKQKLVILFTLLISHIIIDTRIPVKWIMKYIKRMEQNKIDDMINYGFMHIGIDHRLHELVILILSIVIEYI